MCNRLIFGDIPPLLPDIHGVAFMLAIVAGGLVVLSLGVVVQVMLASRNKTFSLRTMFSGLMSLVWMIPVLVTVGFFAFRVATTVDHWDADGPSLIKQRSSESVNFTPMEEPPAWTKDEVVWDTQTRKPRTIVISARAASVEEAERRLALQARHLYEQRFPEENLMRRFVRVSPDLFASHALAKDPVRVQGIETVFVSAPGLEGRTYSNEAWEVYWQLDFSPQNMAVIREAGVMPRLWMLGGGVGLLSLIVIAVATYLRLDHSTQGRYRFRLKCATTTLIVAIGLLATACLPIA